MLHSCILNVHYFCCCNDLHALPLPGDQAMGALTTRLPFGPRHIGLSDSTTIAILCALIELISESPQNAKLVKVNHITLECCEIRIVHTVCRSAVIQSDHYL